MCDSPIHREALIQVLVYTYHFITIQEFADTYSLWVFVL